MVEPAARGARTTDRPRIRTEALAELRLVGWAAGTEPGRESIELRVAGRRGDAPVSRVLRADVCAALGLDAGAKLGFEIDVPPTAWREAGDAPALSLQVVVDGVVDELVTALDAGVLARGLAQAAAEAATDPRRAEVLTARLRAHVHAAGLSRVAGDAVLRRVLDDPRDGEAPFPLPDTLRATVERHRGLVVEGWVLGPRAGAESLVLVCDGRPVPCPVRRIDRADVQRATGSPVSGCGFEVEVPPSIWQGGPRGPGGAAASHDWHELHLEVDGFPLGRAWRLRAAGLASMSATLHDIDDDSARRRLRDLLDEHVEAAHGRLEPLPDAAPEAWTPMPGTLRRRWLDARPLAAGAAFLLSAAFAWGRRWDAMARLATRLELRWTRDTGLLDEDCILAQAREAGALPPPGTSVADHWTTHGAPRGWIPNPLFDPRGYVGQLPGRRHPPFNPLLHWALVGRFAGRKPCAWFDAAWHLDAYHGVASRGIDPLRDFLVRGASMGRRMSAASAMTPHGADLQGVALRSARRRHAIDLPRVAWLLGNLPPDTALPRDRPLPWWPVLRLDGGPAPSIDAVLARTHAQPARDAQAASAAAACGERVVDVFMPVYAGIAETLSCVESVLASRPRTAFELVVIDDCSPEPALSAALRAFASRGQLTLLANEVNLGFVRTVNRGLALHPDRDVVILNSDTVVHGDWIDRLLAHADGRDDIASVTPLSGNATVCSYPATLSDNWEDLELDAAALDELAAEVNRGRAVDAPTGVGFCMLMTRHAMDRVGLLDVEHFGRGYGEENDWCQRAAGAGLRNLLSSDLFVRHRGAVSFGGEAERRMAGVLATLETLHPGYGRAVDAYIAQPALARDRARLDAARLQRAAPAPRVLMVSHARGGGTERHERERAQDHAAQGLVALRARPGPRRHTLRLAGGDGGPVHPALRLPNLAELPADDPAALAEVLRLLDVRLVEVHHLVDFTEGFGERLVEAARLAGVPVEATLHDYYAICPRINLVGPDGLYCGEPDTAGCTRCLRRGTPSMAGVSIVAWRARSHALLQAARRIRVPDEDVRDRFLRHLPALDIELEPHAPDVPDAPAGTGRTTRRPGAPFHLVVPGAIGEIKGFRVLAGLAEAARRERWPLKLTVLGFTMDDARLRAAGVAVLGRYDDATLGARLRELAPDAVLIPSIWPETYSYVLSAVFAAGLRPVVFDLGAQGRRVQAAGGGLSLPLALARDPVALGRHLMAALEAAP